MNILEELKSKLFGRLLSHPPGNMTFGKTIKSVTTNIGTLSITIKMDTKNSIKLSDKAKSIVLVVLKLNVIILRVIYTEYKTRAINAGWSLS
jgi:phage-related minor tail protein